ncbi:MAG: efflux RND transporter permease subunit [Bacteroidales bacterium]
MIESVMRNKNVVILLVVMLVAYGILGLINMPKQEFPIFTIREGLVIGVYPGASSSQVEEQLTKPLEDYLFGYKEVNKSRTYSISRDGMAIVVVSLNDNVNNNDQFWSKFRHGLDEFKRQVPSGVAALVASNDFGETSAILVSLESKEKTYRELATYLDDLESRLRQLPSVSNMSHYGLRNEQISIYLDKDKLASYKINPSILAATLYSQGFTTVSGSIENSESLTPIHISDSYLSEYDVAEQIIYTDLSGNFIRLKDVARIEREYPANDSYITNNGSKCLLLSLEMLEGNNIVKYVKVVKKILNEFEEELPDDITLFRVADQSEVVAHSVNTFLREMLIAICTVVLVVLLLQPLRVASIAAMTIPITIFITIGILYALGFELNTVTLAGLIVVLGIIVDDSIVIIDNYLEKLDHGIPRWEASAGSARELFKSILSATLAISITFYPFLFSTTGMFHDFLLAFPWTVTIALFVSLLVAMFFIPFVQYSLIKKGLHGTINGEKTNKNKIASWIQEKYDILIHLAFKFPKATIGIALLAIVTGIIVFLNLPQKMMPITERNQFAIEIYLPPGTPLSETAMIADSLENLLKDDKRITSITKFIGTTSPRFHTCYAPNFPSKSYAQFIVSTTTIESTFEVLDDYTDVYADYFPNAAVRFKQLDYVFAATPVEIRLSSKNINQLKKYSEEIIAEMKKNKNLYLIRTNFEEDLTGVNISLDNIEANSLGISRTAVATNMALQHSSGIPVTTIWEGSYPVNVVLKTEQNDSINFDDIPNDYITSFTGIAVPLHQIADISADWTPGQIVRRNGVYCMSIYADVRRGENVVRTVDKLSKKLSKTVDLPEDVTLTWGGSKEQDKVLTPMIIKGLIAAVVIIFMILVFHFRKISLALLILGISSLSIFGGTIGIAVMRIEYSLTTVLGVVALMGIIVRNGIIMYDYAEDLRMNHGYSAHDAALEAGKRRMRPIFLTSAAASMGVIPMILSNSALWAPMGTVICFGTWFSMLFVVTALPVSYWVSFERADKKKRRENIKNE